ncbi:hypothetical protein HW555_009493 [Spodoptera exigua]|uniref:Uncharacterized protein n=1 Tax=Spodoptera exigua TaxID=7107 RepID=A0A835L2E9_SPOEX|nr:hypothetical protein HW555_009493 [Spodoptera exigua]
MRKTSQDGGDSTSITSGIENEIKKPGAIAKTKRNSIKRKVQNFSHESDDAVIEPLLQKDKEKPETTRSSAKFNLLSKTKTDDLSEKGTDKDKLITDDKLQKSGISNASNITDRISPNAKENNIPKITNSNAPLHNHMNTNVFGSPDGLKGFVAPKSQILVEIDGCKQVGYNPSPLIFTTAKIHTDGKTKHMEPVQVTPVPILSTIEVSVLKSGSNASESSGQVSSNISTVYAIPHSSKSIIDPTYKAVNNAPTTQNKAIIDNKISNITSTELDKTSKALPSSTEIKPTQPKISPTGIPVTMAGNKSFNKDNKSEKDEKYIKPPTTQAGSDAKVTLNSGTFDKTKEPEPKIELIKTAKLDSIDSKTNKERDDIKSEQLQRQSIVDKEDTISNIKSTNDLKTTNKSVDSQNNKSADSQKPFNIETSDKTKLPKPSANNIPVTNVALNTNTTSNTAPTLSTNVYKNFSSNKSSIPTATTSSVVKSPIPTTKTLSEGKSPATVTTPSSASKTSTVSLTTSKTMASSTSASNATASTISKNITIPVTTTPLVKKTVSNTTVPVANKTSVPASMTVASSKVTVPTTTKTIENKSVVKTTPATNAPSNKTSTTSSGANKGHSPIVSTSTVKVTSGPHTTSTIENKATSNSILTAKPNISNASLVKPSATTASVSKALNTEKSSGADTSGNIKPEVTNASSNAKSQVSNIQSKPTNSITTTKPSKISSEVTPATTSQKVDSAKSQNTITTAKSVASKTIPQNTAGKLTDFAPKSSTSNEKNEKPSSVKSTVTSSSVTSSGVSNVTATAAATSTTLASSGSSSKTTEGNKQNDSKSKELSNGSKSLKA